MPGDPDALEKAHLIGQLIGLDFSNSPFVQAILPDPGQLKERASLYLAQFFEAATRAAIEDPIEQAAASSPSAPHLTIQLAMLLEDLHWADDASLDTLVYLVRACQQLPVLLIVTARHTLYERRLNWDEEMPSHTRLKLEPLAKEDCRHLVQEILQKASNVPASLEEMIVNGAEGNPFYVEELIKMLIDERAILPGEDQWQIEAGRLAEVHVPSTLAGVLQARLDGLPAPERDALQRASVIGRVFWDDAVQYLSRTVRAEAVVGFANSAAGSQPEQHLPALLEALRRRELIFARLDSTFSGSLEYLFKHAILRDVTYETVLKRQRRIYHAQAAVWIIEKSGDRVEEYAGLIAEHFAQAGDAPQSAAWYGRAGKQAQEADALDSAIAYFQKALELSASHPALLRERAGWLKELAEAYRQQARYADAMQAFKAMLEAAEAAGDLHLQAQAWVGIAFAHEWQGQNGASLACAERAEGLARQAGPEAVVVLAEALYKKGGSHYFLGDGEKALEIGQAVLALSETVQDPHASRYIRVRALNLLGTANETLGRYQQTLGIRHQTVKLALESGDQRFLGIMLSNLSTNQMESGLYQEALASSQQAIEIAYRIGSRHIELSTLSIIGQANIGLGRYPEAEAALRQSLAILPPESQYRAVELHAALAWCLVNLGQNAAAAQAAHQAQALLPVEPSIAGQVWLHLGMCNAWLAAHKQPGLPGVPDAPQCFAASLKHVDRLQSGRWRAEALYQWGCYEIALGDLSQGRAMCQEAHAIFTEMQLTALAARLEAYCSNLWYNPR
jgi:tetratricopeptide (TPR) repeat protein